MPIAFRRPFLAFAGAVLLMTPPAAKPAMAQAMKNPGEAQIVANVVKPAPLDATPERIAALKLPQGFEIKPYATGLKTPRVIVVAPNGDLYVSNREDGEITLIRAGRPDDRKTVLKKTDVHGLALKDGKLFFVTVKEIFEAPVQDDGTLGLERKIVDNLPDAGQHPNRTIAFGPDGMLYASLGSTCNECDERNPENAAMVKMKPDGTGRETVATGLRNTIGFDFQPGTGAMFGWDDGVDWLGDKDQPEEFNKIETGADYGWPLIFGDGMKNLYREPKQGTLDDEDKQLKRPLLTWAAHASSMQFAFYGGGQFPAEYSGDGFVTMHGSWNAKPPSGYEVLRVTFENGEAKSVEPFVTGFLVEKKPGEWARFARPFGLAVDRDGSLLVGDDQNGVIYKVTHKG